MTVIVTSPRFVIQKFAPSSLPLWVQQHPDFGNGPVPLMTWANIPNSVATSYSQNGGGINPAYTAQLGCVAPSAANGWTLNFPVNKWGIQAAFASGTSFLWNGSQPLKTYWAGFGLDTGRISGRLSNLLLPLGDAHWPVNSVARFFCGADVPYWDVPVIGCNASEWRNDNTIRGSDDTRRWCHLDGSSCPGHDYWANHFREGANQFMRIQAHNLWWVDNGHDKNTNVADFATGKWLVPESVAIIPTSIGDDYDGWTQKHKITEDIFCTSNSEVMVNRATTPGQWDLWAHCPNYNAFPPNTWENGFGALNEDDNYGLYWGTSTHLGARCFVTFPLTGTAPVATTVCTITGSAAAEFQANAGQDMGMIWCKDRLTSGSFLAFTKKQSVAAGGVRVYEISQVNSATFNVDALSIAGTAPPSVNVTDQGPILNGVHYVDQLKGFIFRQSDAQGIYYVRTG